MNNNDVTFTSFTSRTQHADGTVTENRPTYNAKILDNKGRLRACAIVELSDGTFQVSRYHYSKRDMIVMDTVATLDEAFDVVRNLVGRR